MLTFPLVSLTDRTFLAMTFCVGLCRTFQTTPPLPCPNSQRPSRSSCFSSPIARLAWKNSSIRSFWRSVQSSCLNSSCNRSMETSGILRNRPIERAEREAMSYPFSVWLLSVDSLGTSGRVKRSLFFAPNADSPLGIVELVKRRNDQSHRQNNRWSLSDTHTAVGWIINKTLRTPPSIDRRASTSISIRRASRPNTSEEMDISLDLYISNVTGNDQRERNEIPQMNTVLFSLLEKKEELKQRIQPP